MKHNKKIHTCLTFDHTKVMGEINTLPSMTVPDMSMSPQEILLRFSQGRSVPVNKSMIFTGDDDTPDVRTLDIHEAHELAEHTAQRIRDLEAEIERKQQLRKQRKQQQRADQQKRAAQISRNKDEEHSDEDTGGDDKGSK